MGQEMPFWQRKYLKMNQRKKPIQTGLEIDVKPETDQEILNRLAEAEVAKRKMRGPVQRPRYVQSIRGLLAPEPRTSPFMGLLAIPVTGSKP